MAQPRAIAIASGLLALLGLVPGLPTLPFLTLAAITASIAIGLLRVQRRQSRPHRRDMPGLQTDDSVVQEPSLPPAIALELGPALAPRIEATTEAGRLMGELIPGLRELVFGELGVMLPGINVRAAATGPAAPLDPASYRILLGEVPMAHGTLPSDRLLALAGSQQLTAAGIGCEPVEAPGVGSEVCHVAAEAQEQLRQAGIGTLDPATAMVLHLGQVLKTYAHEFVGIQETQALLDVLERTHPSLVHEVVPKVVSLQTLSEVLRRLLEEGLPVRNLREILETLAEWGATERDAVMLVEHVRCALQRQISHRYLPGGGALQVVMLDPMIEQAVRDSIQRTDRGSYLAMEPDLSRDIIQAVKRQLQSFAPDEPLPVVLTSMEIRRYVRRLLEVELPDLAVLSYNELLPQIQSQPVARVTVEGP